MMNARTLIALLATVTLWGSAFPAIRQALHGYSPGQLALLRFAVASLCLAVYAVFKGLRLPPKRDLPLLFVCGALGITVYHVALNHGELTVAAGAACLIINTSPVFTAILARLFLGERLKVWGWAGIGVSFLGVALIGLGEGGGLRLEPGVALILFAALSSSVYFVIQKPLLARYSALEFTAYTIWAGTVLLLVFAPGLTHHIAAAPVSATLSAVYLGIFPAAAAYLTWAYLLARVPVTRAASFLYMVPVLAIF
ncbi:MAG: DMT family transporter, partial [Planctomycetota bacterium]|nr:DMT family transporter [Planctomycetota bacterium]